MRVIEKRMSVNGRKDTITLYTIGDLHMGALNCAEKAFIRLVDMINADPNAIWIGGGDVTDAVILNDAKRFDVNTLPNWMLTGNPKTIKGRIGDILAAQRSRFLEITKPIHGKCLGMIEGNHEYAIFKHHNRDHLQTMCEAMNVPNLTDCAFIRVNIARVTNNVPHARTSLMIFICHGHGGGRTAGSEPNKLRRLSDDKDADIILTGHSHVFCILPPIPMLYVPARGALPEDPAVHEKYAGNWGSFMYCYKSGPSTYDSRANYPLRPMYTIKTVISPFRVRTTDPNRQQDCTLINMQPVKL